jgi:valyl-tRNA synthetase
MLQPYPAPLSEKADASAEQDIEWLKTVIVGIRNIRGEMNIPPGKALGVLLRNGTEEDRRRLSENSQYLKKLARLDDINWLPAGEDAPAVATALAGELEILVPMAGLIDKEAELSRLGREIGKLEKDLARLSNKLNNAAFVDKAPVEVVARERDKMQAQQQALELLEKQLQNIQVI